jgi:hypothetical protein
MRILFLLVTVFLYCSCSQPVEEESTTASSWAFPYFEKADSINPILSPGAELAFTNPITGRSLRWEKRNVLNPTAVVKEDQVYALLRTKFLGRRYNGSGLWAGRWTLNH